jgi:hypothetical protein
VDLLPTCLLQALSNCVMVMKGVRSSPCSTLTPAAPWWYATPSNTTTSAVQGFRA